MSLLPIKKAISASETDHIAVIELLFYAYQDFTADPDRLLLELGFGRAHHRVLYFVSRRPGLTVAELLDVLGITKQSLGRVLKQLIDDDYILQQAGINDRRQRELYPTKKGRDLSLKLSAPQSERIERALKQAGLEDSNSIRKFLAGMLDDDRHEPAYIENLANDDNSHENG